MRAQILKWSLYVCVLAAPVLWASTVYVWPVAQLFSFFLLLMAILVIFVILAVLGSDWYERTRDASTLYGGSDRTKH